MRTLTVSLVGMVSPVVGTLLAWVDALISQKAGSKEDSIARAITETLREGIGLRTYENMRTLAELLTGAEGNLPPDLGRSEPFMRSFAVCAELSARAEDNRKVRYLFNLLMKGVMDRGALDLERDYELYAGIVSELSVVELHILGRLAQFEEAQGLWRCKPITPAPPQPSDGRYIPRFESSESKIERESAARKWVESLETFEGEVTAELSLPDREALQERITRMGRTGVCIPARIGDENSVGHLTQMGRNLVKWAEVTGRAGGIP